MKLKKSPDICATLKRKKRKGEDRLLFLLCVSLLGCHDKVTHIEWLALQKFILSALWRLERGLRSRCQTGPTPSEGAREVIVGSFSYCWQALGLCQHNSNVYMVFSPCVSLCAQISPLCKDRLDWGAHPSDLTLT